MSQSEIATTLNPRQMVGQAVAGKVAHILSRNGERKTPFGALVDIGLARPGMLHVSRLAGANRSERQARLSQLTVGSDISVVVMTVLESKSIENALDVELSEREASQRESAHSLVQHVVTGTIGLVTRYGAFVDLRGGLRGLLHVSNLQGSSRKQRASRLATLRAGDAIDVRVLEVCNDHRPPHKLRINLGDAA